MTHIFIVNEATFKVHLEYMFAGTGYSTNEPDFIGCVKEANKSTGTENTFVEMIADISKVRPNDKVAFYVTGCKKIFGFFKVIDVPFFTSQEDDELLPLLDKYLPLRIQIAPDEVFSEGITEIEALDDISNVQYPYQMCWSLIYRKLTGMRGCAFVTDYESDILLHKITEKNAAALTGNSFTYDSVNKRIVETENRIEYEFNTENKLTIKDRLLKVVNGSFERHLQAYIIQNFDSNQELRNLLLPEGAPTTWIGNEVVCSAGEQRIDILIVSETEEKYQVRIVELKYGYPRESIIKEQLVWYIKWVQQYIVPNLSEKAIEIIPTVIADAYKRNCPGKRNFENASDIFNNDKPLIEGVVSLMPVEYIKFIKTEDNISFTRVF